MKFERNENTIYLIQKETKYTIPNEDIQRLIARPGTRVLRMVDKEGNVTSTPLSTAVGEIEGYAVLKEALDDQA